jgi:RNA polymerase sigma-70 factor, ECF subfamily
MPTEGEEIIRRMARGDRDAFVRFYDRYAPLAWGVLRRMFADAGEAAEVLQDVFWELWRRAATYDAVRGTPEAWVMVRARSRAIDRLRSVRRRETMFPASLEDAGAVPAGAADPAPVVVARETVRGALKALPDGQREVIELAYLGGLSQSEIAARLAQPLGTVKTRMRLGMERLRDLMGARA